MKKLLSILVILVVISLPVSAARYVIIRISDGKCVNAVNWDGNTATWSPNIGYVAIIDTNGIVQVNDTLPDTNNLSSVIKSVTPENP